MNALFTTVLCLFFFYSPHAFSNEQQELIVERDREHLRNSNLPLLYDTNKKDLKEQPHNIHENNHSCEEIIPANTYFYPNLNPQE